MGVIGHHSTMDDIRDAGPHDYSGSLCSAVEVLVAEFGTNSHAHGKESQTFEAIIGGFACGCPVFMLLGCTYSGNAPLVSTVRSLACSAGGMSASCTEDSDLCV